MCQFHSSTASHLPVLDRRRWWARSKRLRTLRRESGANGSNWSLTRRVWRPRSMTAPTAKASSQLRPTGSDLWHLRQGGSEPSDRTFGTGRSSRSSAWQKGWGSTHQPLSRSWHTQFTFVIKDAGLLFCHRSSTRWGGSAKDWSWSAPICQMGDSKLWWTKFTRRRARSSRKRSLSRWSSWLPWRFCSPSWSSRRRTQPRSWCGVGADPHLWLPTFWRRDPRVSLLSTAWWSSNAGRDLADKGGEKKEGDPVRRAQMFNLWSWLAPDGLGSFWTVPLWSWLFYLGS